MSESNDEGWVRDPNALLIVRELIAWKDGDEVEVDIKLWTGRTKLRGIAPKSERVGVITFYDEDRQEPAVVFNTGTWRTAHRYIVGWRPRKRNTE